MNLPAKIIVVAALAIAVIGALLVKKSDNTRPNEATNLVSASASSSQMAAVEETAGVPRLLDLGSTKCIPCKLMEPILADLRKEYAGKFNVQFIDVMQTPEAGRAFNVQLIPTQIFFDASGKELFRHEGYWSKEDILGKWKELGIAFDPKA